MFACRLLDSHHSVAWTARSSLAQEKEHFYVVVEPFPIAGLAPVVEADRVTCSSGGVNRASASRDRSDSISKS